MRFAGGAFTIAFDGSAEYAVAGGSRRRAASEREQQSSEPGEVAEVAVARDEANAVVDAALGDQRVGEASAMPAREHLRAQPPGALPELPGARAKESP